MDLIFAKRQVGFSLAVSPAKEKIKFSVPLVRQDKPG